MKSYNEYKSKVRKIIVIICIVFFQTGVVSAIEKNMIKIGFVGGLTGKNSELGIQGRNGVMLAVEEVNQKGGINGRQIQLITKDDKHDVKTAIKVDRELIAEQVVAIIGHMTSAMSDAAIPLINENKIVMISPTTSADKLTGIDDYFFRVISPSIERINLTANYAFRGIKLRRMMVVYDLSNRSYSENYAMSYKSEFERVGGKIIELVDFSTSPDLSYKELARRSLAKKPDGILIVASATDTAMLCQHIRMNNAKLPVLVSGWAQTQDLLKYGGPAVEGVYATQYVDYESGANFFLEFKERYAMRFGRDEPSFAAMMGYEAVMVLKDALSRNPDPKKLKETITKQKTFNGLQGTFEIDNYGDAKRMSYMVNVRNNRFIVVKR